MLLKYYSSIFLTIKFSDTISSSSSTTMILIIADYYPVETMLKLIILTYIVDNEQSNY